MDVKHPQQKFFDDIRSFVNTPIERLIRNVYNQSNGVLVFNELQDGFKVFQDILKITGPDALLLLPNFKLEELKRKLTPLFDHVDKIQNLKKDPNKSDQQQKKQIVNFFNAPLNTTDSHLSGYFAKEKEPVWDIIAQSISLKEAADNRNQRSDSEIKELHEKLKSQGKRIQTDATKIEHLKEKLESELGTFEDRYKNLFSKGELLAQQDIFSKEAEDQRKRANWWLVGIILSIVLLISVLFFIIKDFCFEQSCFNVDNMAGYNTICRDCGQHMLWFEIFKAMLFRLFLLSMTVYLLVFTIKNYNVHMHNKTVNSHKQNSLAAALVLIDKANTQEGRDNIMMQAAASIFTHQKTGHIGKENEPNNPMILDKIIDKIK